MLTAAFAPLAATTSSPRDAATAAELPAVAVLRGIRQQSQLKTGGALYDWVGLRDYQGTVARVFEQDRRDRCDALAIAGDVGKSIAHEIDVRH